MVYPGFSNERRGPTGPSHVHVAHERRALPHCESQRMRADDRTEGLDPPQPIYAWFCWCGAPVTHAPPGGVPQSPVPPRGTR